MNLPTINCTNVTKAELITELNRLYQNISVLEAQQKELTAELNYVLTHDGLTKLPNRFSFEQMIVQLTTNRTDPLGIIVCDIDGLKMINDTFGHDEGDRLLVAAADILKASTENDFVARIGGDEFVIMMSGCDAEKAENVARNITTGIFRYNTSEQRLSITMGFALDLEIDRPAIDLFREADDNMYREKLHQHKSSRSALVQTLSKALNRCDLFQEDHVGRMQDLVSVFGKAAELPDHKISDLRLFAQLHDIGKVGVPDHILLKPSPLTVEERNIVQTHSEQGYQIALASHDLAPIADWMLKHHEWWNGQGYPLGLKGEEIPIECRLFAIADAYDAMTSNRPYRKSLTHQAAISQLKEFSGIQFDPLLVQIFINIVE